MLHRNVLLFVLALPALSSAQVSFSGAGYSQNFDTLDNFGTIVNGKRSEWYDDQTLDGWYTNVAANVPNSDNPSTAKNYFIYNDPKETTTKTRSIGSVGKGELSDDTSDRALSFSGSSQDSSFGPLYVGVRLRNETGAAIDSINLSYVGEIWAHPRSESNFNHLTSFTNVDFRLGGSDLEGSGFTSAPDLGFANVPKPFYSTYVDGNLAINQVQVSGVLSGLGWMPGQDLWIRFQNPYSGNGQVGLSAIDNLSITAQAVPEPMTMVALGSGALLILRRRRK